MREGKGRATPGTKDNAKVIAKPPLIFASFLVPGILLGIWEPFRFFSQWYWGHAAGWPVLGAGIALLAWALTTMIREGENPDTGAPTRLVEKGPYAFSRNPIYVGMVLGYIGISLVVNSAWPMFFFPAFIVLILYGVIVREERYLEKLFGEDYSRYWARVRRWI